MVHQYRPEWVTENGGAGFTVLHKLDGDVADIQPWVDAIRAFFFGVSNLLPVGTNITFPSEVLQLDTATGELAAVRPVASPAAVAGSGAGVYAAPAGARVRWATGGIVAGRRVTGTTFLVPLYGAAYQDDGTIIGTALSSINLAANNYRAILPGQACVYSRPFTPVPPDTRPARPGSVHPITGSSVPDKATVLRSRRD